MIYKIKSVTHGKIKIKKQGNLYEDYKKFNDEIIKSLAEEYSALYFMDLFTDNTIAYQMDHFASTTYGIPFLTGNRNFFDVINENYIDQYVHPDDVENVRMACTQNNVYLELLYKKSYSIFYRVKRGGEEYHNYKLHIVKVGDKDSEPKSVIFGFINRDEQVMQERRLRIAAERELMLKDKTTKLSEKAYVDVLTGLFNRRAYEEDSISAIENHSIKNCTFITADVNGLKSVNDNFGHDAGDEHIKGIATCLTSCFGDYGKIYRIGGDEFTTVIYIEYDQLPKLQSRFQNMIRSWTGSLTKELSVSIGYASSAEYPEATMSELNKIADKKMYQDKSRYYARKGIDRRGSNDVFRALCDSYVMVLKIDLSTDSYWIIRTDLAGLGDVPYSITECFKIFINNGNIHPDDCENFSKYVNIPYLREYFKNGNEVFRISYRSIASSEHYKPMVMEMRKTNEYSDENQHLYLFIKNCE